LGLVVGGEEVKTVDVDVLAGVTSADRNNEINITSNTEKNNLVLQIYQLTYALL